MTFVLKHGGAMSKARKAGDESDYCDAANDIVPVSPVDKFTLRQAQGEDSECTFSELIEG